MQQKGKPDIEYGFLIGGNGAVYVARGWDFESEYIDSSTLKLIPIQRIAFIGTFKDEVPPKQQLDAAQKLIAEGLKLNKLCPNYALFGERQVFDDYNSPGESLYEIIKKWDHWTDDIQTDENMFPFGHINCKYRK